NPEPQTPNPKPQTPNPKPQTPNPKPRTPNPQAIGDVDAARTLLAPLLPSDHNLSDSQGYHRIANTEEGLGVRVRGVGFRVQVLGFNVQGLG
ncbi:hypothetical protein T484DRAFT_1627782, partial [Baffinella frigidus]